MSLTVVGKGKRKLNTEGGDKMDGVELISGFLIKKELILSITSKSPPSISCQEETYQLIPGFLSRASYRYCYMDAVLGRSLNG